MELALGRFRHAHTFMERTLDASMVGIHCANASASIGLMSTSLCCFGVCSATNTSYSVQLAHKVGANDNEGRVMCSAKAKGSGVTK